MSIDIHDDGSNLRFWRKDGKIVNVPFAVAAASVEMLSLLRRAGKVIEPGTYVDSTETHAEIVALLAREGIQP